MFRNYLVRVVSLVTRDTASLVAGNRFVTVLQMQQQLSLFSTVMLHDSHMTFNGNNVLAFGNKVVLSSDAPTFETTMLGTAPSRLSSTNTV